MYCVVIISIFIIAQRVTVQAHRRIETPHTQALLAQLAEWIQKREATEKNPLKEFLVTRLCCCCCHREQTDNKSASITHAHTHVHCSIHNERSNRLVRLWWQRILERNHCIWQANVNHCLSMFVRETSASNHHNERTIFLCFESEKMYHIPYSVVVQIDLDLLQLSVIIHEKRSQSTQSFAQTDSNRPFMKWGRAKYCHAAPYGKGWAID